VNGLQKIAIACCTAIVFAFVFELNILLFSSFEFTKGVNWIFVPSGVRLAAVLVLDVWGALGIVLGSIGVGYGQYYSGDWINAVVAGLLSGLSPLLARKFCNDFLSLKTNLDGLTGSSLLKIAAAFSVISSVMHQVWYVIHGQTQNFLTNTAVMAVGDFTGTLVVLYAARWVLLRGFRSAR